MELSHLVMRSDGAVEASFSKPDGSIHMQVIDADEDVAEKFAGLNANIASMGFDELGDEVLQALTEFASQRTPEQVAATIQRKREIYEAQLAEALQ